jgi:hypothetical protein
MFITFDTYNASIILRATDIEKVYLADDSSEFYIYFKNSDTERFYFEDYVEARAQFNSIMKQMGCMNV